MSEVVFWTQDYLRNSKVELKATPIEYPNWKARMATELLEKWGLVAGIPDGEDSSGRQKLRMMTPQELVERAMDVADEAVNEFDRVGWIDRVPDELLKQVIPGMDEDDD